MPRDLLYASFKDAPYTSQFVGSIHPELKEAQQVLNQTYDVARENDSKKLAVMKDLLQKAHPKDTEAAKALYESAWTNLQENAKAGDYENMLHKTTNEARQFNVNASKIVENKKRIDEAYKKLMDDPNKSEAAKKSIWDNLIMRGQDSLGYDKNQGIVTGEGFKDKDIANDYSFSNEAFNVGKLVKDDIISGKYAETKNGAYGWYKPVTDKQGNTTYTQSTDANDPNGKVFKRTSSGKLEEVSTQEINDTLTNYWKSNRAAQGYINREVDRNSIPTLDAIDNSNLSPQEKQLAKQRVKDQTYQQLHQNEIAPAIEAAKIALGYKKKSVATDYTFDAGLDKSLKLDAARENTVREFSSETSPSTPTVNPYAPQVSTIDPKNPPTNLVTMGNTPISSKEELAKILLAKGEEIKRPMTETQAYELADRALNFTLYNQGESNSTSSKLKLYGLNVKKYSEQEVDKIKTDEANKMMANSLNFKLPLGIVDNANMNPVMTLTGMSTKQIQELYKKVIPSMGKISLSGHIASPEMNKKMTSVLYSQADQSKFELHDGKNIVEFNGLNEVRDYMVKNGYKSDSKMGPNDFELVNRRTLSTNGEHGDFQVRIKGDKKNLSLYTRGGDALTKYTSPVNQVAKNSFLQGTDTYNSPENLGQVEVGGIPTDYFTKTVPNKNFTGKKDQSPFITVVYSKISGSNSKFTARPLMNYGKDYPRPQTGTFLELVENTVVKKLSNTPFAGTQGLTEKEAKNTLGEDSPDNQLPEDPTFYSE